MITEHSAATVLILQHGEKVAEPGDPGLTRRGREQAARAADLLAPLAPAAVISSPLVRARETAAPLAERCGLPVRIDRRVSERLNLEVGQDVGEFVASWNATQHDRDRVPPGGRSSSATAADMLRALDEHAVANRPVVIVGHGGATVDLLRDLLGDDELEARAPGIIRNGIAGGAITSLVRDDDGAWTVHRIGSVDHLPPAIRTGHTAGWAAAEPWCE